jgi:hypothetical protein
MVGFAYVWHGQLLIGMVALSIGMISQVNIRNAQMSFDDHQLNFATISRALRPVMSTFRNQCVDISGDGSSLL